MTPLVYGLLHAIINKPMKHFYEENPHENRYLGDARTAVPNATYRATFKVVELTLLAKPFTH